jgi:protein gp37
MGKTSIEWTDASWNPIVGCTEISPGCANCYAARLAATRLKNTPQYKGLAVLRTGTVGDAEKTGELEEKAKPRWTGEVRFLPERLEEPLRWKKPRRIFVCDMGDLFHESVEHKWLLDIFQVMRECSHHTFQILTKRAARMKVWIETFAYNAPPNLWIGVSVENQHFADERIPLLLATPAAVRWISAEPLLGSVDLPAACEVSKHPECWGRRIDWVVCGGESGANARPMSSYWACTLRDRCQASGIPFFFKQWGEWAHVGSQGILSNVRCREVRGEFWRVGKKAAGRLLDGREWNEFPSSK